MHEFFTNSFFPSQAGVHFVILPYFVECAEVSKFIQGIQNSPDMTTASNSEAFYSTGTYKFIAGNWDCFWLLLIVGMRGTVWGNRVNDKIICGLDVMSFKN